MIANPNRRMAEALVAGLEAAGVRDVVFSPGSRSTPIVLALARRPAIRRFAVTDERSAGFFALGLARETRRPVAVLTTSGTAAANLLPAAVEASLGHVPLVLLTADRPPELRDCGAAQTVHQVGLFGAHAKLTLDLPTPAAGVDLDDYWPRVALRAVATAESEPAGPVHLNLPLREPLFDVGEEGGAPQVAVAPELRVHRGRAVIAEKAVADLAGRLAAASRGLVVCGPRTDDRAARAIVLLAERLGWPLLADPLSGLRYRRGPAATLVDAYDLLLRDDGFAAAHRPDALLRFGGPPTSKPLGRFLAGADPRIDVLVASAPAWPDPAYRATDVVRADVEGLAVALAAGLPPSRPDGAWLDRWLGSSRRARAALDRRLDADDATAGLFEGAVFRELRRALPDGAALHVGNSMPVRDIDAYLGAAAAPLEVVANRGANGIDGVLSTALGAAAAALRPTALVVGDLSFLHDVGGLQIAVRHRLPLVVVVVANDGGGIFSFLPQRALASFESDFATPHGLDLEAPVRAVGGAFTRISSWTELAAAARRGFAAGGLHVIEVPSDRARNLELHRRIETDVLAAVFPRRPGEEAAA